MLKFGMVLYVIGALLMAVATLSGIGMFIYEWGKVGLEIGPSAWEGFVLFAKFAGAGFLTVISGFAFMVYGTD